MVRKIGKQAEIILTFIHAVTKYIAHCSYSTNEIRAKTRTLKQTVLYQITLSTLCA